MATKEVKSAERGEARGGMRTGAIVLGIIAGLAGLVSAVLALMVGGLGAAVEPEGASQVIGLGWSALGLSLLLGLIGAALWIAKPQLAALIMAIAGVAIVFSISMFAVIATAAVPGAALLGRVRQEAQGPPRTQRAPSGEAPVGQ